MTTCMERHGHTIVGQKIIYDERPITWEAADAMAGKRLDRRRNYMVISGKVCESSDWSSPCSGCSDDFCSGRGGGCRECGYTGKRRDGMWIPVDGGALE